MKAIIPPLSKTADFCFGKVLNSLNILVVGCGRAGANLIMLLEQLGHDVSVLDANPAELERLNEFEDHEFAGEAMSGIPIDVDALRRSGIETCDGVAVVTSDDSVNIMVAQIASEVFGVQRVVARITDPALKDFFVKQYGIKAVCPTNLTAQSLLLGLLKDQDSQAITLGATTTSFFLVPVPEYHVGRQLNRIKPPQGELLFGVMHPNGTVELNTTPSPVLTDKDQLIYTRIAD